jgi:propanol-preferring alcohol dehydrogenase
MTDTMRAMVLHESGDVTSAPLVASERAVPDPGPGEVRVRVHVCAVCRTDIHVVEEDLPPATRPIIPGHQVVGTVDARGEGADRALLGRRVGVAWVRGTCGACRFCTTGRENLCESPVFGGYHADGGYAEYVTAPAAWVYEIPERFGDEEAAPLLCAGIIGYRALQLSGVQPGQRLGLYGFGASAHIVIQIAIARGCEVHVCSLRENHRQLALELGAVWAGEAAAMPPALLHAAILFAPAGELVPPALRALDRGGTLACAGIHMSPIPRIDYDTELFGERVLRSVTANTRADGDAFLREAAAVGVKTHTNPYKLADANHALADLKAGAFDGAAVLHVR